MAEISARRVVEPVGGVVSGARLLLEGMGMLRRQRSLWGLAAVPVVFSCVAVVATLSAVVGYAPELHALLTGWFPALGVVAWYQWLWLGPAKLFFALLGYLLFLAACGLGVLLAFVVANLVASPFLDALSQRVERIAVGRAHEGEPFTLRGLLVEGRRTLVGEFQRSVFFLGVWVVALSLGFIIPGAQLLVGPFLMVFSIFFLPLDYASYSLDRRQIPFRDRRAWVGGRLPMMAGFGGAAFLSCLVPGLNFLMIPAFVAGGTLMVLRHPPTGAAPSEVSESPAAP